MIRVKDWDAVTFFSELTTRNKLAVEKGFKFRRVSGLAGLEEAIQSVQATKAFVMVDDTDLGVLNLENTPHYNITKTIFLAMRHKADDSVARRSCIETMQQLFSQFVSAILPERVRLMNNGMTLSPNIRLQTVTKVLAPGVAMMYFTVSVTTYADLSYNETEWLPEPEPEGSGSGLGSGTD